MNEPDYILVVDDDPDLAQVELDALRDSGYQVRIARNGHEALSQISLQMPSVILLDMLMPHMDGWEFAKEFRKRHGRAAPLIVVTAAEHATSRGTEIAADEVLSKPFDLDELLTTIERCTRPASQ